jgi:hypothetical protein
MERESFEDEKVAAYMNEHFINIKIDREERPDLDHIYMDAVQAIAGNGGWPLNVFLTPEAKPFYGGTYFPPQKAFSRPSWTDVLVNISDAWKNRREELVQQAENLTDHIGSSGNFFGKAISLPTGTISPSFTREQCDTIAINMLKTADTQDGGFGAAPKFPQTFTIQYLLAAGYFFKNEQAMAQAELSLQKMLKGGIYDHLAGGMARYSTDSRWLAPHFEKMLYDNALLVSVLADAYQATGKTIYADAIHKTLGFIINEMEHPDGGFYAAIDADSEGEEGKFYVWDKEEVDKILGKDADLYCKWYDISEKGNWGGKNILHISKSGEIFAIESHIDPETLKSLIRNGDEKLLKERNKRTRPATDDKILLGWNALMITAFCKASAVLGDETYEKKAIALYDFIRGKFSRNGLINFHTYKNQEAKHPAFLDDFAYCIQACIHLQEVTANQQYLLDAKKMTEFVLAHFENEKTGLFYYTNDEQADVITRKIEVYDGAIPSGNAVMTENLFYLSVIFEKAEWKQKAYHLANGLSDVVMKYPGSFGTWALFFLKQTLGINEIVLTGNSITEARKEMLRLYMPNKVFQSSITEAAFPLLMHKSYDETALIYVCKNHECYEPVIDVKGFRNLVEKLN